MKSINRILISILVLAHISCDKESIEIFDNSGVTSTEIELIANHTILVADGIAEIILSPLIYEAYTYKVDLVVDPTGTDPNFGKDSTVLIRYINDRLKEGDVEYFLEDGTQLQEPYFTTTDVSKTSQGFYAEILGEKTDVFTVNIVSPLAEEFEEVTYPVVFHMITTKINEEYGEAIPTENVDKLINALNTAYGRIGIITPNGANAKVKFKMAEYDIDGDKMKTPGINTILISDEAYADLGSNVDNVPEVLWDSKKYLNIWVMKSGKSSKLPSHAIAGFELDGLDLELVDETFDINSLSPDKKGFIIKWSSFAQNDLDYGKLFGTFFGLYETKGEDYCSDTFIWVEKDESNSRWKINDEGMRYMSVNIMDESSHQNTISQQQVIRIRKTIENCPVLWAYKSDWAFTGN